MTAIDAHCGGEPPFEARSLRIASIATRIDDTCQTAIGGRRASRTLADWANTCGLKEAEIQVLWRLRLADQQDLDQTTLASVLAFSPAQISTSVEHLRVQGLLSVRSASGDRRRHVWQLTPAGRELLDRLTNQVALRQIEQTGRAVDTSENDPRKGAA